MYPLICSASMSNVHTMNIWHPPSSTAIFCVIFYFLLALITAEQEQEQECSPDYITTTNIYNQTDFYILNVKKK